MKSLLLLPFLTGSLIAEESLQDQLDARKEGFEKRVTPEKAAENRLGVDTVRETGILEKALNVGDKAPDFTLNNAEGKPVQLSALLKNGPVILTWYRGSWCPYCNLTLNKYQNRLEDFKKEGAQLVALTPELPDRTLLKTSELSLKYEVLTDLNNEVAAKFGTVFQMIPGVEKAMRKLANNLQSYNGTGYDESEMPLSATYLIASDGTIAWAFLDSEYRNRASTDQILAALDRLNNPEEAKSPVKVVKQFWNEVWNPPYNRELFDTLVNEDFVIHTSGSDVTGREGFRDWVASFQAQVSDLRFKIDDIFLSEDGEKVTTIWTCSGKNTGMFNSEPDRRPVSFTGITVTRVVDGQMVEKWVQRSAWELYRESFADQDAEPATRTDAKADSF